MKRIFDLFISSVLIVALLPVLFLLIVSYWLTGNRPVFYIQERLGLEETKFYLLKLRTLKAANGLPLEERSFALGNWLRRTGLDELPQLINVLKGEMSLVGPRPLPTCYQSMFTSEQRRRFCVKPGITGLTQVNGGSQLTWEEKFIFDLQYVQTKSFVSDIKILLKTIFIVFNRKDDGLDEKPFTGN